MKKFMTFAAVVALMAVAFTTGAVWAQNHNRATLTITTSVKEITKVEELQAQVDNLEAEHTARRVLGNELAENAFRAASHDGYIDYRIYADGRLVQSGHIPVMSDESEWRTVQRLAVNVQEHFDGQHKIETELV